METTLLILLLIAVLVSVGLNVYLILRSGKSADVQGLLRDEFRNTREESAAQDKRLREEVAGLQKSGQETLEKSLREIGKLQQQSIDGVEKRVKGMQESSEGRLEQMRGTVETKLKELQQSNEKRLEQMRETVDEKLQSTLEKRLGESFDRVSKQLEAVHKGLGEMQELATGVGELKRVLTNVSTRGTWGEYQLGDILEQILTRDQYSQHVAVKPDSAERVEFAVRLPGTDDGAPVWLPIDAKFPQEDYQRLLEATEAADKEEAEKSTAALMRSIRNSAKDISTKYIAPPHTTDFAIMFLPTEGLYAEVLRQPGVVDGLQQDHRVLVAGPTTLTAILNSLRMGFRTLAIEKRSSEVWKVLGAVKTEFGKFGDVMAKIKKQLGTASKSIEQTEVRTRAMARKLGEVEALPEEESAQVLDFDPAKLTGPAVDDEEEDEQF